jgi:predicted permease
MLFVHVPDIEIYALFFTAAAALPTASSVTMMAESYGLDSGYSSLAVGTSSLLSVLSIPLTMMIAQWLIAL